MVSAGRSIAPLSRSSFSQWSHHATTSCRKPIAGPGSPRCGYLWLQGPISPRTGIEVRQQAEDGVGVPVGPAADGQHRGLDGRVVLDHRAVTPVVIAPLVAQPGLQ